MSKKDKIMELKIKSCYSIGCIMEVVTAINESKLSCFVENKLDKDSNYVLSIYK